MTLITSVWLLLCMSKFMNLQMMSAFCCIVALCTFMRLFPRVLQKVRSQVISIMSWKVALCALMRLFLATVKEGLPLQIRICTQWFVALWTIVPLFTIALYVKAHWKCPLEIPRICLSFYLPPNISDRFFNWVPHFISVQIFQIQFLGTKCTVLHWN